MTYFFYNMKGYIDSFCFEYTTNSIVLNNQNNWTNGLQNAYMKEVLA